MSALPPLDRLRRQIDAIARDEQARAQRTKRRRRLRNGAIVATALLGAGGVAVGADLISSGAPEPNLDYPSDRYAPATPTRIVLRAPDEPLDWGVRVYRNREGQSCSLAGQIRGTQLGRIRDGVFRPYEADRQGPCIDLEKYIGIVDGIEQSGRLVLFGQATRRARTIVAVETDGTRTARERGPSGAFLFVFRDTADRFKTRIEFLDRDGKPVQPLSRGRAKRRGGAGDP